jgi:hypothetical protein
MSDETAETVKIKLFLAQGNWCFTPGEKLMYHKRQHGESYIKSLHLKPCKLQMCHAMTADSSVRHRTYSEDTWSVFEEDEDMFQHGIFSDECTFHVTGKVNIQTVRFWGSEQPNMILKQP